MKTINCCLTAAALGLIATPVLADQHEFDGGKNCPTLNASVSWHDYISGKKPPIADYTGNPYGVEFLWAKHVAKPTLGNIATNVCYSGSYIVRPAGYFDTPGYYSSMVKEANGPIDMKGLSGDPNNNELNVWGVLLKYKEDGTLYDSAGNKVGMLRCYFSFHNCDTYLSKDDCSSAKRIAALGKPQVCRKTPVASQILKAPEPTEARIAPAQ